METQTLKITGDEAVLSDTVKDYVTEKLKKVTRHFKKITFLHVHLMVVRNHHKIMHEAKAHLCLPQKKDIIAEAIESDMYAAIDSLINKLDRQVIDEKGKMQGRD